jgi:hypothetical protein
MDFTITDSKPVSTSPYSENGQDKDIPIQEGKGFQQSTLSGFLFKQNQFTEVNFK